jgi:predicted transcriptional regulator
MQTPASPALVVLTWLGYINVVLAAFNLVPGFPLDGGRVLRALAWWATGDAARATRLATRAGQAVAIGFMVLGIVRFFGGAGVHGLWLVFIGWFLHQAASASRGELAVAESLRGITVADVMERDYPTVGAHTELRAFVDEQVLRSGRRCFVVVDGSRSVGLITPHEVKQVDRARWGEVRVHEAMRPLEELHAVSPAAALAEAVEVLAREDVNQLVVVDSDRVVGVLSRGRVMRALQVRSEIAA